MVFSSLPAYLDPSNWHHQQQQPHQSYQPAGSSSVNAHTQPHPHPHPHHLAPLPPPPPPPPPSQQQPLHGPVDGGATIRPRSMAERARLANMPMPDAALKCPRCESTNTKFCYFNNYSLSQPRHFCKTCRRYWTRGGALRNVPVGGGCRRNKRSKSSGSNKLDQQTTTSASGGSMNNNSDSNNMLGSSAGSGTGTTAEILGLTAQFPPLGFMTHLHYPHHHLGEFSSNKIGLSYGGISTQPLGGIVEDLTFQLPGDSNSGGGGNSRLYADGAGGIEQWRIQQFPYIGNLDLQAGLYPSYETGSESSLVLNKALTSGVTSQLASVKMEDSNNNKNSNNQELNLTRQMVGIQGNEQFWSTSGSAWTDLSGFSSSSTSNNNNAI